jgi:hypothetical protein
VALTGTLPAALNGAAKLIPAEVAAMHVIGLIIASFS